MQKQMKCLVSWVTQLPKLRPTTQCQVGLYFLSNSFLMQAAMSFSMLNFSRATLAQSIASCCISSFMSACLITAFRSAVDIQIKQIKLNLPPHPHTNTPLSNFSTLTLDTNRQKYMHRSAQLVGSAYAGQAPLHQQQFVAAGGGHLQLIVGGESDVGAVGPQLAAVSQDDADAACDEFVQQNFQKVFGQHDELSLLALEVELVAQQFVPLELVGGVVEDGEVDGALRLGVFQHVFAVEGQGGDALGLALPVPAAETVHLRLFEDGQKLFEQGSGEVVIDSHLHLLVFGVQTNIGDLPIVQVVFIIFRKLHKGRTLQHHFHQGQLGSHCHLLQLPTVHQSSLFVPGVVNEGVFRGLSEDLPLEVVGKVIHVGVAEVAHFVEAATVQHQRLALPLRLHRHPRDQIHGDGLVSQYETCVDIAAQTDGQFLQDVPDAGLFALFIEAGERVTREDDVVMRTVLLAEPQPVETVGPAGAPLLLRNVVDQQHLLPGEGAGDFPEAGAIVFAGRDGGQTDSPLRIVDLVVVDLFDSGECLLDIFEGVELPPLFQLQIELLLVLGSHVHLLHAHLLPGHVHLLDLALQTPQEDAAQLVHEVGRHYSQLRVPSRQVGQQSHLLVLREQHVVGLVEEVRVGQQPGEVHVDVEFAEGGLVVAGEEVEVGGGGGGEEEEVEAMEGERVEFAVGPFQTEGVEFHDDYRQGQEQPQEAVANESGLLLLLDHLGHRLPLLLQLLASLQVVLPHLLQVLLEEDFSLLPVLGLLLLAEDFRDVQLQQVGVRVAHVDQLQSVLHRYPSPAGEIIHEELDEVEEVPGFQPGLVKDAALVHEGELILIDFPVQILIDLPHPLVDFGLAEGEVELGEHPSQVLLVDGESAWVEMYAFLPSLSPSRLPLPTLSPQMRWKVFLSRSASMFSMGISQTCSSRLRSWVFFCVVVRAARLDCLSRDMVSYTFKKLYSARGSLEPVLEVLAHARLVDVDVVLEPHQQRVDAARHQGQPQ